MKTFPALSSRFAPAAAGSATTGTLAWVRQRSAALSWIIRDEVLFVVELEAEVVGEFASNFLFQIYRIVQFLSFDSLGRLSCLI